MTFPESIGVGIAGAIMSAGIGYGTYAKIENSARAAENRYEANVSCKNILKQGNEPSECSDATDNFITNIEVNTATRDGESLAIRVPIVRVLEMLEDATSSQPEDSAAASTGIAVGVISFAPTAGTIYWRNRKKLSWLY